MSLFSVLWLLAVLAYGFGDLGTTVIGLQHEQLEEGMPAARALLGDPPSSWGILRFGAFKVVLLAVFYLGSLRLDGSRVSLLVPTAITVVGVAAVVNNVRVIRRVR